eukprot:jgi/Mesvir1/26149/Mv06855-RA.2
MEAKRKMLAHQLGSLEIEARHWQEKLVRLTEQLQQSQAEAQVEHARRDQADAVLERAARLLHSRSLHLRGSRIFLQLFAGWKALAMRKRRLRQLTQKADRFYTWIILGRRSMGMWKVFTKRSIVLRLQRDADVRVAEAVHAATQLSSQEVLLLRDALAAADQRLALEEDRRTRLEKDMKKAFMRGVCALNIEAMAVMRPKESALMAPPPMPVAEYAVHALAGAQGGTPGGVRGQISGAYTGPHGPPHDSPAAIYAAAQPGGWTESAPPTHPGALRPAPAPARHGVPVINSGAALASQAARLYNPNGMETAEGIQADREIASTVPTSGTCLPQRQAQPPGNGIPLGPSRTADSWYSAHEYVRAAQETQASALWQQQEARQADKWGSGSNAPALDSPVVQSAITLPRESINHAVCVVRSVADDGRPRRGGPPEPISIARPRLAQGRSMPANATQRV